MLDAVPEVSVEMEGVAVALVVSEMTMLLEYTSVSVIVTIAEADSDVVYDGDGVTVDLTRDNVVETVAV